MCARLGPFLYGHEIAINCAALTFMVPLGVGSAAAVRVGQQLGRGDRLSTTRRMGSDRAGRRLMSSTGLLFVAAPGSWPDSSLRMQRLLRWEPTAAGSSRFSDLRWLAGHLDRSSRGTETHARRCSRI
jgi:hypothetical protein